MKTVDKSGLLEILTHDKNTRINFALEIENTNESENCIFNFKEAFVPDSCENSSLSEFMAVFCDSEPDVELNISINALSKNFIFIDECCKKIQEITNSGKAPEIKLTLHVNHMNGEAIQTLMDKFRDFGFDLTENSTEENFFRSFYFDAETNSDVSYTAENLTIRMLDINDEILCGKFENGFDNENEWEENYFGNIFDYSIRSPKYKDCGIIGSFDAHDNDKFVGYLSYYGLDEILRDVSYIYVDKNYRQRGYGKALLNFFKTKNIVDKKISYYSYPENAYSEKLAESCGFFPCAYRYEFDI